MKTSFKKSKLVSSAFVCATLAYGCSATTRTAGTTQGVAGDGAAAKDSSASPAGGDASSKAGPGGASANEPGVPGKGGTAGAPAAGAPEAGNLALLQEADKKLRVLPPGGSFDTRAPGGCTFPNSTARVVFLAGTSDGTYVDIPPALKEQIKLIFNREMAKTNFRFSEFVDGSTADTVTPSGAGIAGTMSVGMYKALNNGLQRPGSAGSGAAAVTSDGICEGTSWGSVGIREGAFNETILQHELGHALGLKHQTAFESWRTRYLMPSMVTAITHYGLVFLGTFDQESIMATGEEFSPGDVRVINYLYPQVGGTPRSLKDLKAGTEVETGLTYVRGIDDPSLRLTYDYDAQSSPSAKGLTWRTPNSDDYNFAAQGTPACRADVALGQPCSVRGFTCSTRQGVGYDGAGRVCAGDGDRLD